LLLTDEIPPSTYVVTELFENSIKVLLDFLLKKETGHVANPLTTARATFLQTAPTQLAS